MVSIVDSILTLSFFPYRFYGSNKLFLFEKTCGLKLYLKRLWYYWIEEKLEEE